MVLSTRTREVFSVSDMAANRTHNLGAAAQIPLGEGRRFEIAGQAIAVFRSRQGQVFATQAECPHRSGPLADGLIGGDVLICPLHSFKFSLETGEPAGGDCSALRTYPVALNDAGDIIVGPTA